MALKPNLRLAALASVLALAFCVTPAWSADRSCTADDFTFGSLAQDEHGDSPGKTGDPDRPVTQDPKEVLNGAEPADDGQVIVDPRGQRHIGVWESWAQWFTGLLQLIGRAP